MLFRSDDMDLFDGHVPEIDSVLDDLVLEEVFDGVDADFHAWKNASAEVVRVLWDAKTERRKLSTFAEEFFRRLAQRLGGPMLLTKGSLHRLMSVVDPKLLPAEVSDVMDLVAELFSHATPAEETSETEVADEETE